MVTQDDLTPLDANGSMARRGLNSLGDTEEETTRVARTSSVPEVLKGIFKRRKTYGMSSSLLFVKEPSSSTRERNLVKADEVIITALGLPTVLAEDFNYTYGIFPIKGSWQSPDSAVRLFDPQSDGPLFYLHDQFVPESPPVNYLGINYHGKLVISTDREAVSLRGEEFDADRQALPEAADSAFRAGGSARDLVRYPLGLRAQRHVDRTRARSSRCLRRRSVSRSFWESLGRLQARNPTIRTTLAVPESLDDLKLITELRKISCQSKTTLWRFWSSPEPTAGSKTTRISCSVRPPRSPLSDQAKVVWSRRSTPSSLIAML
ncbi:hypothetical protein FRB90_002964 [Tulasnella sp. 427]|nr:hypothetical protein FRB90_002964 [Tulasnella sp. 427]